MSEEVSNTDTPEWMRARIAFLEGELQKAPIKCKCHPGVRWNYETWGRECPLTALTRRAAELEAALRGLLTLVKDQHKWPCEAAMVNSCDLCAYIPGFDAALTGEPTALLAFGEKCAAQLQVEAAEALCDTCNDHAPQKADEGTYWHEDHEECEAGAVLDLDPAAVARRVYEGGSK